MRILLLADIHSHRQWYRWIASQNADLTVIAGDLLDGFSDDGVLSQQLWFSKWLERFPSPLALSSGNHDAIDPGASIFYPEGLAGFSENHRVAANRLLSSKHWMDCLERPGVVTDGRTEVVETRHGPIVVTTIPFYFWEHGESLVGELWRDGATLRNMRKAPWLVLHHEPPADTAVGGMNGDPELPYTIQEYQPNLVVSGHIHGQPYVGSFAEKLDDTWCFNPGRPSMEHTGPIPNHIVLDLKAGNATWHASLKKQPGTMHQKTLHVE